MFFKKFEIRQRHKEIAGYLKSKWVHLLFAIVCMLMVSASTAASAYVIKPVLDDVFINKKEDMLKLLPFAVLFIYLLRGIGLYGQEYFLNYIGQVIIRKIRDSLYSKIQDLPLSFFEGEKTGELMSRLSNDVNIIKSMVSTTITSTLRDFFTICFLIGVIFYQIWSLALFAILILPLAFYPIIYFGRKVRKVSTGCQEAMAEMNSFAHETIVGAKIIKAFSMENYEKERFYEKTSLIFKMEIKNAIVKALSSPVMEVLAGTGVAFIIWYGGSRVISGVYTTGTFISFLASVIMLYDPVKKISKLNNAVQQGLSAVDRVYDIIERKSDLTEALDAVTIEKKSHFVKMENVWFKYKGSDEYILKNINLEANKGEIIALVGMSGGGKTSLVNLIPRFFDPTKGKVLIDDIDVKKIKLSNLRDQVAFVTQEPILFNDTVYSNIAYGKADASFEDVVLAAKSAYAYDFIMDFPEGFDTVIGEFGNRLSGGQKQRLCIARALVKDAPILVLDEATSALDTNAEKIVQKALENLMKGRTTFMIAHRLSTISNADRIVVIENGEIKETGTHLELIKNNGPYKVLYELQYLESAG
ncbi:MAG: ABC transporter ATP-binding protein [Desulforegulaceae bacterium]|nr:ABC transporter ATP-binding protein [Desulforegulaceae bacterium]